MVSKYSVLLFFIAGVSVVGGSCIRQEGYKYEFDKASPNGLYHVKVEYRKEEAKGTRDYTERLKIQYLKNQELILAEESENSDQYESSLRLEKEEVEWVGENVLHRGDRTAKQSYYDEVLLLNSTDETIKYVGIGYGTSESYMVFDLTPRSQITLPVSPRFKPDGSSNYFLGYTGITESGKKFQGLKEHKQRQSPSEGPLVFQVIINASDLR